MPLDVMVVRLVSGLSPRVLPENTDDGLRDDGSGNSLRTLVASSSKYWGLGYAGGCSLEVCGYAGGLELLGLLGGGSS